MLPTNRPGRAPDPVEVHAAMTSAGSVLLGCHQAGLEGAIAHVLEARVCRTLAFREHAPHLLRQDDLDPDGVRSALLRMAALGGEIAIHELLACERSWMFETHPPALRALAVDCIQHSSHPGAPAAQWRLEHLLVSEDGPNSLEDLANQLRPEGANEDVSTVLRQEYGHDSRFWPLSDSLAREQPVGPGSALADMLEARVWRQLCVGDLAALHNPGGPGAAKKDPSESRHLSVKPFDPWDLMAVGMLSRRA